MAVLRLVPIYFSSWDDLLAPLAARIGEFFGLRVDARPPAFDPELAFDRERGQYNSRVLLSKLCDTVPPDATRILGVAGVDLFIPVLTYVFGEAELEGRTAVVSAFRLDNELYGLPGDRNLLFDRLLKEAVHELGHTFGLLHCHRNRCVMASSTYVDGIDLKSERFCDGCVRTLRSRLRELGTG